jgi:hypothetical protein
MKRKGKDLENIIKLIEETLKDSSQTKVYSNHKIKNTSDRYREFDVFIESKVSGHDIKIAIECKDYKSPVSVEKIEAFETKCNRIKSINKKVFVSSNGFQLDAINAARELGIELQTASKLEPNQIKNWFPIIKLNIKLVSGGFAEVHIDVDESYFEKHGTKLLGKFLKDDKEVLLNDYAVEFYIKERVNINKFAHLQWMRLSEENQKNAFPVSTKFEANDLIYIDHENAPHKVIGITATYLIQFEHELMQPSHSISLDSITGDHKAQTITIDLEDGAKGTFVRTSDNKTTVYLNGPDGSLKHLKLLATYDPKTDKFDIK